MITIKLFTATMLSDQVLISFELGSRVKHRIKTRRKAAFQNTKDRYFLKLSNNLIEQCDFRGFADQLCIFWILVPLLGLYH